jgi:hypothetical protein|nr:hypothetical protein [uncultured Alistipes sp.]
MDTAENAAGNFHFRQEMADAPFSGSVLSFALERKRFSKAIPRGRTPSWNGCLQDKDRFKKN